MARGNSRAQSELVDRLKAKVANREIDKELKSLGAAQTRAQEKAAYEKKTGRTDADERPWTKLEGRDYEKLASSGPLSTMKNSKLVELLTKPKTTPVSDEKNIEISELSFKASDYNGFIGGDNYYQKLTEGGENSDGDRVDFVDDDGNSYSYDETEDKTKLPDLFVEKDGNTYQVKRSITVPIEIDEEGVLRSTATSVDDLEVSFGVRQVTMRPGEYVKDGRLIATYNGGEEHGAYRSSEERAAEKNTPEYKKARQAFEAFDTQVKQWNSIIEKHPRLNQKAKLKSGEQVFEQGVGAGRRSTRFN
jgi:hypothetical protein